MLKKLNGMALAAAVALCIVGIAREAFASTANCQRHVTRTWDAGKGDWVYLDAGCPPVQCDTPGTCASVTVFGTNQYQCMCPDGSQPACVATVHYGTGGPDSAACLSESCPPPKWCPSTWAPEPGDPQILTCPCVN